MYIMPILECSHVGLMEDTSTRKAQYSIGLAKLASSSKQCLGVGSLQLSAMSVITIGTYQL